MKTITNFFRGCFENRERADNLIAIVAIGVIGSFVLPTITHPIGGILLAVSAVYALRFSKPE